MGGVRFELSELPPRARAQVEAKLRGESKAPAAPVQTPRQEERAPEGGGKESRPPKYRNQKATRLTASGRALVFDSQKEARRYDELLFMLEAGRIDELRLQRDFTLQEAYTTPEGERIRAIRYKADFTYWELNSEGERVREVVEDTKSGPTRTKEYQIKKKLMRERFGIDIQEVYQC